MKKSKIFTQNAWRIINKRLRNEKITQQESNYLSRFVRPKLREIALLDAQKLLKSLDYNPKLIHIERKIKDIILKSVPAVEAIIVCGSAIQTNYTKYRDIDTIIATKKVINKKEKNKIVERVGFLGKDKSLNLDIQIYSKNSIIKQYSYNPSLIYQLEDSKVIYGKIDLPKKVKLSNLDLKMKLDWSEGLDIQSQGEEIYYALRNAMLVLLLMNKRIDNQQLNNNLVNVLGEDLFAKLRENRASKSEKKLALSYLNLLTAYLENELNKQKWGNIIIENQ